MIADLSQTVALVRDRGQVPYEIREYPNCWARMSNLLLICLVNGGHGFSPSIQRLGHAPPQTGSQGQLPHGKVWVWIKLPQVSNILFGRRLLGESVWMLASFSISSYGLTRGNSVQL